jgi:hypothetical protein
LVHARLSVKAGKLIVVAETTAQGFELVKTPFTIEVAPAVKKSGLGAMLAAGALLVNVTVAFEAGAWVGVVGFTGLVTFTTGVGVGLGVAAGVTGLVTLTTGVGVGLGVAAGVTGVGVGLGAATGVMGLVTFTTGVGVGLGAATWMTGET